MEYTSLPFWGRIVVGLMAVFDVVIFARIAYFSVVRGILRIW